MKLIDQWVQICEEQMNYQIKALKEAFKQDITDIKNYHACLNGDCPHEKQIFCLDALVEAGYDGAVARLLPLLEKLQRENQILREALAEISTDKNKVQSNSTKIWYDLGPSNLAEIAKEALKAADAVRDGKQI